MGRMRARPAISALVPRKELPLWESIVLGDFLLADIDFSIFLRVALRSADTRLLYLTFAMRDCANNSAHAVPSRVTGLELPNLEHNSGGSVEV